MSNRLRRWLSDLKSAVPSALSPYWRELPIRRMRLFLAGTFLIAAAANDSRRGGGTDERGTKRVLGGNPEAGPFDIETAWPGDALVVHFNRIRLNRDYAISDDAIVERALDQEMSVKMKDGGKSVRWHLDLQRGIATSERPGDHLKEFAVLVRPMLGCVATAPGFASAPPPTGDSGRYGGNMDFNEIVEGVTVYLPVNQPG